MAEADPQTKTQEGANAGMGAGASTEAKSGKTTGANPGQGTQASTDERALRREKRAALLASGMQPYPATFHPSATAEELEATYKELENGATTTDEVVLAGRIMTIRRQGKIAFFVLRDATGPIQLFFRIDNFPTADAWEAIKQLDLGDFIGIKGCVMRSKRGQLSVAPTEVTMLSKALTPLPEKFHGLSDKETRYRQRYADMIANPEVLHVFKARSRMISAIRRYMDSLGYYEVETPILQYTLGGANARPFITHHNALNMDFYLRIATELHLKRLVVGGMERVYELGRQFRNEGMDQVHNPEFTTIEAYCAYSDMEGMKRLCEGIFKAAMAEVCTSEIVEFQGQQVDLSGTWRSASMSELVSEACGEAVSLDTPREVLLGLCEKHHIEDAAEKSAGVIIADLYDALVEHTIVNPTFVTHHPVEVSPLAKKNADDPRVTDRFELVILGHEYANAFSELNDPVDQEERFLAQVAAKEAGDDEAMEFDKDYIRALEYGLPPTGGIGIGIDRMAMLLLNQPSIRDVLPFPHMRPEGIS